MILNFDTPAASFCLVICLVVVAIYIVIINKRQKRHEDFLMRQKSKERAVLMTDNLKSFDNNRSNSNKDTEKLISEFSFPQHAIDKVAKKYNLDKDQMKIVVDGLREYFFLSKIVKGKPLSMPSLVVDDLWHEFILCTKSYREFCDAAFGFYLDHNPSIPGYNSNDADSMARVWHASCLHNNNRLRRSRNASALFTIDYSFGITPINNPLTMLDTMGMLDVSKLRDNKTDYVSDYKKQNNSSDLLIINAAGCSGASHTSKTSSGKDNGGSQSSCSSTSTSDSKSSCSSASSCSSCGGGG